MTMRFSVDYGSSDDGYGPFLCGTGGIDRYFYQDIMKLEEVIQQIDINKLVLGFFGAGGVMLVVQLGFENPWPATIGFVLFIIGIRIKIHMG